MKVCFLTELPFFGKVDVTHENMRTEFAWMNALDADNVNLFQTQKIKDGEYDVGIVIVPKTLEKYTDVPILSELNRIAKKTAFMQEGPSWFYQDIRLDLSMEFFNIMSGVDFVLAHNECDRKYYEGLLNKKAFINPTLMIESVIGDLGEVDRKDVMVGGNLGRWYGGFDSYVVASEFQRPIYAPTMGRMKPEERTMGGINHLPYMNWKQWIHTLNQYKYAVHLNPNTIGGTFYLNCAYLGIPCIGNINTNTQRLCFPMTSVEPNDIVTAKQLTHALMNNPDFYDECSSRAKINYKEHFRIDVYKTNLHKIFDEIL
jgi:hypothetical protein